MRPSGYGHLATLTTFSQQLNSSQHSVATVAAGLIHGFAFDTPAIDWHNQPKRAARRREVHRFTTTVLLHSVSLAIRAWARIANSMHEHIVR